MKKFHTGRSALAATALTALAVAVPATAGAATTTSLKSVEAQVKAANTALANVRHYAKLDAKLAIKEIGQVRSEAGAAANGAKFLKLHSNAATAASAAGSVALQYNSDLRTFTSLVHASAPSVQPSLVSSLQPVIAGRSQAISILTGLLGGGSLTGSSATSIGSLLTGLLGAIPGETTSLSGLLSGGGLPTSLQGLLGGALSSSSGSLDLGLGQLNGILGSLPAPVQADVQQLLGQLGSLFTELGKTLSTAATTIDSSGAGTGVTSLTGVVGVGDPLSTQFGSALTLLQGLLHDLSGFFSGAGSSFGHGTPGTPGVGGSTGLPGIGGGISIPGLGSLSGLFGLSGLGSLSNIPSFLSGLLGSLGTSLPGGFGLGL
jgi:hypothetical protein